MNESLQHLRNALDASGCDDWEITCEDGVLIAVDPGGRPWRATPKADDQSIWSLVTPDPEDM